MATLHREISQIFRRKKVIIQNTNRCRESVHHILNNKYPQETKTVKGWVKSLRKMKDFTFADVSDGSCSDNCQLVIPKELKLSGLTPGSSIAATGQLQKNSKGQTELFTTTVTVVGDSNASPNYEYPFSMKQKHSHDYSRQYLHLRPKLSHFQALLRVRHRATIAVHTFFDSQEFFNIHTPILTSNDCEGAGEVFKVLPVSQNLINSMKNKGQPDDEAFFGEPSFLSVSGQLHLEAISRSFCKVYSFSPTFRAENSKSRLHLSEFYMIEAEQAFANDLFTILRTIEDFVKYLITTLLEKSRKDLEIIAKYDAVDIKNHILQLEKLTENKFLTISFKEAVDIFEKHTDEFRTSHCPNEGFTKEQELFLVKHAGNIPIFVVDWPKSLKPFYMKTSASPETVSAVDLLVPNVGELCGGSLREDNFELLQTKLQSLKLVNELQWYLDLRRFGNVPTGGFGMGFERFLQLITGLTNIKDTIPFPRWPHNLRM